MSRVRTVFFGTPEFALHCLKGLYADEHFEIVAVVSQPDRPAGRSLKPMPSPVKKWAEESGLPVYTSEKLNQDGALIDTLRNANAEVGVVVAFGQIMSEKVMALFTHGCVNVHASLLPRWRGAAPIQRAIEAGDKETGVCLQKMVRKLDAGDVLGFRRLPINTDVTAIELHDQLADLSTDLLHVELMDYVRGHLAGTAQDESHVTYASKLDKSESLIHFSGSAIELHNKVRAFTLGPGAYVLLHGKRLKILKTKIFHESANSQYEAGTVFLNETNGGAVIAQCGEGQLQLIEVQPESRPRALALQWYNGLVNKGVLVVDKS